MSYLANLGTAISQLGNTIIGGHPDESLSARAHYEQKRSRFWAFHSHCVRHPIRLGR
jgi:hypothetical protein